MSEKVGVREGARGDLASEHHEHHGELANTLYEGEALKVRDALSESDPKLCNQLVKRLVSGLRRQ